MKTVGTSLWFIRWRHSTRPLMCVASGTVESVLDLAQILEDAKTEFKVYELDQCYTQEALGMGGFKYWLAPNEAINASRKSRG